ncbi:MAG: hypothetical protein HPY57_11280 [Ignavibacteria bacterium]|nr:hypothetical protein [Ignavibacteria bacterium]
MRKYILRSPKIKFLMILLLFQLFLIPTVLFPIFNFQDLLTRFPGLNRPIQSQLVIDTVSTLNPTFNWYSVSNASKYQLIIKEDEPGIDDKSIALIRTFELTDTFFVVPDLVLQDGKSYSWNVRAFDGKNWGNFGDEFYLKVNLKKRQFQDKPVTISPGKFSPEKENIKNLNPVFKWLKHKDAVGYELIIFEESKSGKKRKIFSEENFGLIKDTFFVLKGNLLKPDLKYVWQIRAVDKFKNSSLSDERIFYITLPKKIIAPEAIYPGYKVENKEIVATTTPTFIWKRIPEAESYSLAISKRDDKGNYKLIYDTEQSFKLKDTVFTLPAGILENNSSYRWNIKANLNDGRSIYSGRLYFTVNVFETPKFDLPQADNFSSDEIEEILLNLEYAGVVKSFIQAVSYKDKIFISLTDLLQILQIPFTIENENLIEGTTDNTSNYFYVDLQKNKAKNQYSEFDINEDENIVQYDQKYFSLNFIEKLLNLKLDFDFSNLILYVKSERPLPVYNEFMLRQKLSSFKFPKEETALPLLFTRKRSLLNGFIFDYSVNQTILKNQRSNFNLNTALGGEFLYGDFYYSRQIFKTANSKSIIEDFNWKYTPDPNNYLTQVIIGDNYIEGINTYTYRGINLTNEPVEPRKKLGTYIYRDFAEPHSYVELYLNNELIDLTQSDDKSNFYFEIPIKYGMSNYEFRIHTLKGETKSYRKIFQIPYDLLPEGVFNYNAAFGRLRFTQNRLANIEFKYGLKDYLTLNAGSEFLSDTTEKFLNFFGKSTLRLSSNLFFNVFYSPKIQSKITASYVLPDYASSYFEYINYKPHKFYNLARLKNSYKSSFYFPIKFKFSELGVFLNFEKIDAESFKRNFWNLNSFFLLNWVSFSAGFNYEDFKTNSLLKRRELVLSSTINFNNVARSIPILNRSFLSSKTTLDILKKKIFSYSIFYTATLTKDLRFQINYENIVQIPTSNFNVSLFLELPQFRYISNSSGKDLYNHQLSGSVGYSPEINQLYFYREPQIGRAGLFIEGFEDKNGNGLKDKDEENIKGVDFILNSAVYSTKLKNDARIFFGLNPYQEYSIKLNETNLKSINYSFEHSDFNILTDGNRLKVIQLPYYETGEIGGIVVRSLDKEEIPISNVKLVVRNLKTNKKYLLSTFSDGSFYFYGLTAGDYEIEIDKNFLEKFSFKSEPEKIGFEINPRIGKLIIENLRFVIK